MEQMPVALMLSTAALNLALAVLCGASAALAWMDRGVSSWARSQLAPLRGLLARAAGAALLASGAVLWSEAAMMAEQPLTHAGNAAWTLATSTHYGNAWAGGMVALLLLAGLNWLPATRSGRLANFLRLIAIGAFVYSRAMVSHAVDEGDLSIAVAVEALHLLLVSLWLGIVFLAAFSMLARPAVPHMTELHERAERADMVAAVSRGAAFALGGIIFTGLANTWRTAGFDHGSAAAIAALSTSTYGGILLFKLVLVALAVVLGASNRFRVMPALLTALRAGDGEAVPLQRRFVRVLRIEALVLTVALLLAAILSASAPPMAG